MAVFTHNVGVEDAALTVLVADTVTVAVPVNGAEQLVDVFLATTLNVVVVARIPVGRLIVPPLPATGTPTSVKPFLSW
jgi:UTP-glucose-1-phosphate uridylyltransferase